MKILVVIETLGQGGAEQMLVSLLPALKRRGIGCQVVALWQPYDLALPLSDQGIDVCKVGMSHRWMLPEALFKLVAICLRERPDVIWGHLYIATLCTRLLKLMLPRTVVVSSLHSLAYSNYPASTRWKRIRRKLDMITGRVLSDRIVAVSQAVADDYTKHLGWEDINVIHNAVSVFQPLDLTPSEKLEERARFDVKFEDFLIVLPARHVEIKGHRYLIEAVKILTDSDEMSIRLIAPGNGSLRMGLQSTVDRLGLGDRIHLVDALPQQALFRLIQAADIVAMPSLSEGLCVAAVEAMALGKPIVLTAVGGNVELVEHDTSALLVPAKNPTALAEAIRKLQRYPELRVRLGGNASKRARELFNIEHIADRWVAEFAEILDCKKNKIHS